MVADRALTPATRLSLGGLLPHQQADRTRAPLEAQKLYRIILSKNSNHRILPLLSESCFRLQGRLPTCYSPVCHYPKKELINRSFREPKGPFDLHTLGTQPTLILSYDQTLIEKRLTYQLLINKQLNQSSIYWIYVDFK